MRDHWVLLLVNATASAVLIVAGLGKLVVPRPLGEALAELLGRDPGVPVVRAIAAVELLAAVSLLIDATRGAGALLMAALGAAFAVFGAAGLVRKSTLSCGCLGRGDSRPLGAANIAAGIGLTAVLPVNVVATTSDEDFATGVVLTAALLAVAVCLLTHRRVIASLLIRKGTG